MGPCKNWIENKDIKSEIEVKGIPSNLHICLDTAEKAVDKFEFFVIPGI